MFSSVMFWSGIVLLIDSSLGLMFHDRWQKVIGINIQKIAFYEIGVGLTLIAFYFLVNFGL